MAKRYSPSLAISRGSLLMVRPRERVAVENVESYLAGLISSGQIESRRYHPSAAPHPSPAPRSRDEPLVDPVKIEVDDLRWAVARAVSGCERRVARDLADAGYQTYCPLGRRLAQRARIKGTSRRERRIRQFCVFSPYIFVGCPKGLEIGRHTHDKIRVRDQRLARACLCRGANHRRDQRSRAGGAVVRHKGVARADPPDCWCTGSCDRRAVCEFPRDYRRFAGGDEGQGQPQPVRSRDARASRRLPT